MMPNSIFNKVCDATISALWMILNEQLNCLKHLGRQFDGPISLVQCAKPATIVLLIQPLREPIIKLMETKYGKLIWRVSFLDSDSDSYHSKVNLSNYFSLSMVDPGVRATSGYPSD